MKNVHKGIFYTLAVLILGLLVIGGLARLKSSSVYASGSFDQFNLAALFGPAGGFTSTCQTAANPVGPAEAICMQAWDEITDTTFSGVLAQDAEFESANGGVVFKNIGSAINLILRPGQVGSNHLHSADLAGVFVKENDPTPLPGQFKPIPGHPVEVCADVSWNNAYHADGTGTAVGTTGVGLWNAADGGLFNTLALTWGSSSAAPHGTGLNAVAAINSVPRGIFGAQGVNMQDTVSFRMLWSDEYVGAGPQTTQKVSYWVNGQELGTTVIGTPLPGLSLIAWNDNLIANYNPTLGRYADVVAEQTHAIHSLKARECESAVCNCLTE